MAGARILVVEDDRIIARDIVLRLENKGYTVTSIASSGEEAVKKAETENPALVLMDIVLEGDMDGIEAARRIRERFGTPIIYLSVHSEKNTLERANITEPYGYLLKPFDDRELHNAVEITLYKHGIEQEKDKCKTFLQSILEGIGDGVVVIDRDYKIILANNGYCSQSKVPCDSIVGKHCYEISHHFSRPCHEMDEECSVKDTFQTGVSHRVIHTHLDKDEVPIYIETISYPLRDAAGAIVSAIEVLTDVTERVHLEHEVAARVKELEDFHDFAVGRELRMVELKEEIENLKKGLEKCKAQ